MAEKRSKGFAKKLRCFFRSEDWLHTPHMKDADAGVVVGETVAISMSPLASPRIYSPLNSPAPVIAEENITGHACDIQDVPGDRQRTEERYKTAVSLLEKTLDRCPNDYGALELDDILKSPDTSKLQRAIEQKLNSRTRTENPNIWKEGRKVIEQVFVVLFPLAKNLLTIFNEGQGVSVLNPCGLVCTGLLILLSIADRELARTSEIEKNLHYALRQLERLNLTKTLPTSGIDMATLGYRAMDVRSAVITYIAVHVRRESRFGIVGNIAGTFVKGDRDCESATTDLQDAVTSFNEELLTLCATLGIQTVTKLEDITEKVDRVNEVSLTLREKQILGSEGAFVINDKFIVPYQKNEHFTGRRNLLARLCEKLCETAPRQYNHRVALYGLGGVGKTQLALEYVYSHKSIHDRVYWISGVDQASLLSGFQEIARRTRCVSDTVDLSPSDVAKLVLSWLNQQERWLLVIDNLDDATVVDDYLPERSPQGLTLVTTRNPNADEIDAVPFEVGLLDAEDAVELLAIRSKLGNVTETPEGKVEAEKIVSEVGFLPLAIEQAGAYIREASKDLFKFLPSYRNNPRTHHNRIPKGNWKYAKSVASTWRLSFQQVEQNNRAASKMLQLFAFLNPDGILVDFLEAGKTGLDDEWLDIISDFDILSEALGELERFSLIRRQVAQDGQQITMHRLIQCVIIDDLDQFSRDNMIDQVVRLGLSAFPDPSLLKSSIASLEQSRRYRSQVMSFLQHHEYEFGSCRWHILAARVAGFLYVDGFYEDCAKLSASIIEVRAKLLGPEHPETLQSMHNLASTYRRMAQFDDALTSFRNSLDISKRVLGSEHVETLHIMNRLAQTYTDLAQYETAYGLHQETLSIAKRVWGNEHPQTLQSMDGLARVYWRLGRYHEALSLHQETLEISTRVLGLEHVDTLSSMDGLGWTQWRLGRYHEAVALFQRSLNIRKRVQGTKHPDTLFSMDGLAWGHWRLGRYKDATSLFQEISDLNIIVLGPSHPDTVMNIYGIAWGHWRLGRYKRAQELFQNAFAATTESLGANHPDTLLNRDGLAWCHWSFGEYDDALRLHREILDHYQQTLGPKHPDTIFSRFGIAWALWSLGQYQEAAEVFQERLEICVEHLGPDHRDALMSLNGLAATYERLGRYDEAVALFLETVAKRKKVLAPEHPEILESLDGLATAYRSVGRYQEAIEIFQKVRKRRTSVLGEEHPDTLQTIQGLAMCYEHTGRRQDAKDLYQDVLKLRIQVLGDQHPDTLRTTDALGKAVENLVQTGTAPASSSL